MLREVLTKFPYINLVITGQLIFLSVFIGVLFWVFRSKSLCTYNYLANIPLDAKGESHD